MACAVGQWYPGHPWYVAPPMYSYPFENRHVGPQEIDARLLAVEQKLDRLMNALRVSEDDEREERK